MVTTSDKQYSVYTNFSKQEVQSENSHDLYIVVQLVTQAKVYEDF